MSKKVLVTGGAGYIGAHTVAALHELGHDPVIVDNFSKSDETLLRGLEKIVGKAPVFYNGSCTDREFLKKVFRKENKFDCVLHFAAFKSVGESVQEPLMYYQNNIDALLVLLEVMKKHEVRDMIFSSSCTVYGQPDSVPVDETAPFKRAESPYGATKQMCERILEDAHTTGFRAISLRYFNPIGAHPSADLGELPIGAPNNLVPYITQTAAGVRPELTIFGSDYDTPDGTCIRDFIHVMDLAYAHVKAMDYLGGSSKSVMCESFNLGTGEGISVLELVKKFNEVTGIDFHYTFGPRRPGDVVKVYAKPDKATNTLGWSARYSIEESLLHAWQWEKKIRNVQ